MEIQREKEQYQDEHVLAPAIAGAQIENSGFETGALTPGWTSVGDAMVDNSFTGGSIPTEGTPQALLTTLTRNADFTTGLSFYDAVPVNSLEGFLGLQAGLLRGYGAVEGAAIKQVFNANAGNTISFDWNFLTDEPDSFGDFAFVVIDQTITLLADASSPLLIGGSGFFTDGTGYRSFSRVLTTSGAHTIAFGVVDKGDNMGASGLLIDKVVLTPRQPPSGDFAPVDCDVAGSGLAALIANPGLLDLSTFAQSFGKNFCP